MRGLVRTSLKNSLTGALILDYVYHMILKLIKNLMFGVKRQYFVIFYATL